MFRTRIPLLSLLLLAGSEGFQVSFSMSPATSKLPSSFVTPLLPPLHDRWRSERRGGERAGSLRMQQDDSKVRRMRLLRIAELRREIALDAKQKAQQLREKFKARYARLTGG
ncbi:hypothetical protein GUITHDRAFT_144396 [Guillardia theta CCMP2712]|uniref:Uncharacterized protein n=2 Tax=Guillardia theta TaxID=55529 RepID=L1IR01_GUITC|nr:hypothetical protein GUITHDRAFT_144396 [Guillardia theta CCMP2712]EKX38289.1 hypothetical protein GUITHDRAFT_144396 [Guillardia theta CCMP2712]|eukprot:XP_005825269.1 hypothetical protein GUITHDRAFT_144396 [Guillardia theta CCMP2712]